ncbi:unnamed protein product [Fraxinus pennsylvanica]|uniref:Uncharacterized protein n=1 Tax=Fraxinus pennsylvanica TaxID=56036 RepID=A0AAD1YWZ6_9LAMI|nr:unnamed protein product [Fraxinus pennsylvanica]
MRYRQWCAAVVVAPPHTFSILCAVSQCIFPRSAMDLCWGGRCGGGSRDAGVRRSLKFDYQDKESTQYIGGDNVLKSNKPLRNTFNKSRSQQNQTTKDEQKRQFSDTDVLRALQKATTHKSKKKKDKRDTISRDGKFVEREIQGTVDYANVRTLCIKIEWIAQLEELERQL